jgi:DNA-directed RNA polymerase specialized sigma24 family protein
VERDDLLAEVVLRVLMRYAERRQNAPSERRHLRRFVRTVLLDVSRRETGRRRCTTCVHYRPHDGRKGGTCQRQYGPGGEPHAHFGLDLDSRAEPQRLDPPCRGYSGRRNTSLPEDDLLTAPGVDARVRNDDMSKETLERALARLIAEKPLRGLLFVQSKLDGRTYDDLAFQHGLSRDQVKRHIQAALLRVRDLILEEAA